MYPGQKPGLESSGSTIRVELCSGGYAYLPYEYVDSRLAADFWTIFNTDWLNLNQFD